MSNKFYITTPIYYPNAEPHLGHVYTTICADVLARFHRLVGDETFLLTGTDEHGVKMVQTAAEKGVEPCQLADRVSGVFKSLWQELDITHDDFIRTSSPRHHKCVQSIISRLLANKDIYLGTYEGWYDEGQEEFVTETEARTRNYIAFNGKPLAQFSEPSYFFRLTKYADRLLDFLNSHPEFILPQERFNEVVSKLKAGVQDLSISRATLKWGIPFPNDPAHVVYVWIDALSNYISALDYGTDNDARFRRFWPADLHLIGKEILWFHAVYWPCILLSLGEPLPRQIFAHGWWLSGGRKMSKTEGNFIGIEKLREAAGAYGMDTLRYYLLRTASFGNDLNWFDAELSRSFTELSNTIGNCLNRVLKMVFKYRGGVLPTREPDALLLPVDYALMNQTQALFPALQAAYAACQLHQCALLPVELARSINVYIEAAAPFKLARDPAKAGRLDTVLNITTQGIYTAMAGLLPVLPHQAIEGLSQLGVQANGRKFEQLALPLADGHVLTEGTPLFQRSTAGYNLP